MISWLEVLDFLLFFRGLPSELFMNEFLYFGLELLAVLGFVFGPLTGFGELGFGQSQFLLESLQLVL